MKVVCVDDEKLALDIMTHLLGKIEKIELVESFQTVKTALDFVFKEEVDVVFLDIEMPEINGLELAEKILEKKPHIDVVFVTAYNEYAVEAFELNAIDYLMKPVKLTRLEKTIERLSKETTVKPETNSEEKQNTLQIKLAHNLSFSLGDNPFEPLKWRTAKARELFLYLLQNKNTLVHKGTLMEMLWGEEELDRGYSILYTTVYNVRKALQTYGENLELQNTNDGYILKLHNVDVDLHTWEKQVTQLPSEITKDTIDDYKRVMAFNTGPYLGEFDYVWVESERHRLETLCIITMQKMVDYFIEENNDEEAVKWLQLIVQRQPELEEAHLLLTKLYEENDLHHLIKKQYDDYIAIQKSFDLHPSPKVKKWFTDYLARK